MMPDPHPTEEVSRFPLSTWLLILTGLLILAACTWAAYRQTHQGPPKTPEGLQARGPRPAWLPDPKLTPGALAPHVLASDVCKPGYARAARKVRESTKREACRLYGVPYPAHGYEIDHLVSIELGGAPDDVANLWPEPGTGKWTWHHKDELENRLHALTCSGELTLREAQKLIRDDWTLAYRKYVSPEPKVMGAGAEMIPESP
jgi:hypothetical protein